MQSVQPIFVMGGLNVQQFSTGPTTSAYRVYVTLRFYDKDLESKTLVINGDTIADLHFGDYRPMNISQQMTMTEGLFPAREVMAVYLVDDISTFAKVVRESAWKKYDAIISKQIDEAIND